MRKLVGAATKKTAAERGFRLLVQPLRECFPGKPPSNADRPLDLCVGHKRETRQSVRYCEFPKEMEASSSAPPTDANRETMPASTFTPTAASTSPGRYSDYGSPPRTGMSPWRFNELENEARRSSLCREDPRVKALRLDSDPTKTMGMWASGGRGRAGAGRD